MADYARLEKLTRVIKPGNVDAFRWKAVTDYLCEVWLGDYAPSRRSKIVQVSLDGFAYFFDYGAERLVAAWGVSQGRHAGERDASRMKGHPLNDSAHYDRGHAIPHRLGGPTDINLVPQLARINRGDFRPLEIQAVATPGALYFTYWVYRRGAGGSFASQKPVGVDQGLLVPGEKPDIRPHGN
jgi:hypothetical protein